MHTSVARILLNTVSCIYRPSPGIFRRQTTNIYFPIRATSNARDNFCTGNFERKFYQLDVHIYTLYVYKFLFYLATRDIQHCSEAKHSEWVYFSITGLYLDPLIGYCIPWGVPSVVTGFRRTSAVLGTCRVYSGWWRRSRRGRWY